MGQTTHPQSDPLAELLITFPLPVKFAGSLRLTAPWRLTVPRNVVLFGVLTGSECSLSGAEKETAVALGPSDFIALGPACKYQLSSGQEDCPVAVDDPFRHLEPASCTSMTYGGGGSQTGLIGGILELNGHGTHPLFSALPPVLHLPSSCNGPLSKLDLILDVIEQEVSVGHPGAPAVVSHLAQVMLIQAARLYLMNAGTATTDTLQGLLHRGLGPALALIHDRPETPWTVASLAERVHMSRSTFSAVFAKVLGVPPMQYLREHRMRTACRLLQDSKIGLKEVSSRVGYDSVSAFSTAFKRFSGFAPGDYRRQSSPAMPA